jgi:hypothetical protein
MFEVIIFFIFLFIIGGFIAFGFLTKWKMFYPNNTVVCSNNGTIDKDTKKCVCYSGWTGDDCSKQVQACNGHGILGTDQTCRCDSGYVHNGDDKTTCVKQS